MGGDCSLILLCQSACLISVIQTGSTVSRFPRAQPRSRSGALPRPPRALRARRRCPGAAPGPVQPASWVPNRSVGYPTGRLGTQLAFQKGSLGGLGRFPRCGRMRHMTPDVRAGPAPPEPGWGRRARFAPFWGRNVTLSGPKPPTSGTCNFHATGSWPLSRHAK